MLYLPLKATMKNSNNTHSQLYQLIQRKRKIFMLSLSLSSCFSLKLLLGFCVFFVSFSKKQTKKKISIIQTRARISQKMILWDFISLFSYSVPSYAHHVMIIMPQMIFFYVLCCHILQFIIFCYTQQKKTHSVQLQYLI